MKAHLTERLAKMAPSPQGERDLHIRDDDVAGFGLCVKPSGSKAFFLDYRIAGRRRYLTIGSWPDWSVTAARERAKELKRSIDAGVDPLVKRQELRSAPTVRELIDRYIEQHVPTLSKRNGKDQISMLRKLVEPEWGSRKVAEIAEADVSKLLAKIAAGRARPRKENPKYKRKRGFAKPRPTPIRANRVGEVVRKMFNLAVRRWQMRADNPAAAFHRNVENEREVFLTLDQIDRLASAIDEHKNQHAADVVRFILLTGARKGEALTARPEEFNLDLAIWTKKASTTKQRKMHRVPLSRAAVAFIRARLAALPADAEWLFPGAVEGKPIEDIRRFWADIRKIAGLEGVRVHDLRHTFASLLASGGMSLPMIGKLLGHNSTKTTQRYAHLLDDPVRHGADAVGELLRPRLRLVSTSPASDRAA
ncbi:MAG TPA: site-specific integrase [Pseudolabrys sp.]|nr:site-specific integrase [Pseudolabrys sp.]